MSKPLKKDFIDHAKVYHKYCKQLEQKYPNSQHVYTEEYTDAIVLEHAIGKFSLQACRDNKLRLYTSNIAHELKQLLC